MRTIKFRAWDGKHMWEDVQDSYDYLGMDEDIFDPYKSDIGFSSFADVIGACNKKPHCHLMQFTGLFDKNGKEIYEGDIISWQGFKKKAWQEVKYDTKRGVLLPFKVTLSDEISIIGNIYENPELIKK